MNPHQIKELLYEDIDKLVADPMLFAKDPLRDFTRNRKLPAKDVIRFQLSMERDTMDRELLKYFKFSPNAPTKSAFYQQRKKLKPDTFHLLFSDFNSHFSPRLYKDKYILQAVDGSGFSLFRDPNNADTFRPPSRQSKRGYSEIYVVAAYQLMDKTFSNAVIKPSRIKNEYTAICELIDCSDCTHGIPLFIADRGFPSYNCFAHAKEHDASYLIRAKDVYVDRLLRDEMPHDNEFDITVSRIIVRHQAVKKYQHPEIQDHYRFIDSNTSFDYIDYGATEEYKLTIRVVRIKITDDTYENLVTNLPSEEFSADDLKKLYHLRWGIETSFRELKHIIGAADFYSKSVEYVTHELWARLILYNFCSRITALAIVVGKHSRKHIYQVNFTMSYLSCREFLRQDPNAPPMQILALVQKYILPIRHDREYERNKLFQRPMTFVYRH